MAKPLFRNCEVVMTGDDGLLLPFRVWQHGGFIDSRQEFFLCSLHITFIEETNSAIKKKVRHNVCSFPGKGLFKIFPRFSQQVFVKRVLSRSVMLVLCQFRLQLRKSGVIFPNKGSVVFSCFWRKRSVSWMFSKACRFLAVFPAELVKHMDVIRFACCSEPN